MRATMLLGCLMLGLVTPQDLASASDLAAINLQAQASTAPILGDTPIDENVINQANISFDSSQQNSNNVSAPKLADIANSLQTSSNARPNVISSVENAQSSSTDSPALTSQATPSLTFQSALPLGDGSTPPSQNDSGDRANNPADASASVSMDTPAPVVAGVVVNSIVSPASGTGSTQLQDQSKIAPAPLSTSSVLPFLVSPIPDLPWEVSPIQTQVQAAAQQANDISAPPTSPSPIQVPVPVPPPSTLSSNSISNDSSISTASVIGSDIKPLPTNLVADSTAQQPQSSPQVLPSNNPTDAAGLPTSQPTTLGIGAASVTQAPQTCQNQPILLNAIPLIAAPLPIDSGAVQSTSSATVSATQPPSDISANQVVIAQPFQSSGPATAIKESAIISQATDKELFGSSTLKLAVYDTENKEVWLIKPHQPTGTESLDTYSSTLPIIQPTQSISAAISAGATGSQ